MQSKHFKSRSTFAKRTMRFYVDAEVPGLTADDVKVDVENKVLTHRGERKVEKEETEGSYRRVERQYGSFTRSFSLPETVDADHISADLKDGVLELAASQKGSANAAEAFQSRRRSNACIGTRNGLVLARGRFQFQRQRQVD